jgi:hypothetical protein
MLYLFKVYALVATIVFGCSGIVMLTMFSWHQAREYAHAREVMRRIGNMNFREPLVISRRESRFHDRESLRVM